MLSSPRLRRTVAVAAASVLLAVTGPSAAQSTSRRDLLLERFAPAVVRVEAVLKTKLKMGGQGQEQDSRLDVLGAIVDAGGLVMIWNSHISSARMRDLMQEMGRGDSFDYEITPVDFKVHLEGGDWESAAFVAATDTSLDLAFLQLEDLPEQPLTAVDFSEGREASVGDEVVVVSRMGRSFDFAPHLESARIGGRLEKPRPAWILDGELTAFGLPVFDLDGHPVGALTTVLSRVVEETGLDTHGFGQLLGRFFAPRQIQGPLGAFILPAERVRGVVAQAKERAAELLAQRAEGQTATQR
jgi:hypothetical protein